MKKPDKSRLHPDRCPLDAMKMGQFKVEEWRREINLTLFSPKISGDYSSEAVDRLLNDPRLASELEAVKILTEIDDN